LPDNQKKIILLTHYAVNLQLSYQTLLYSCRFNCFTSRFETIPYFDHSIHCCARQCQVKRTV